MKNVVSLVSCMCSSLHTYCVYVLHYLSATFLRYKFAVQVQVGDLIHSSASFVVVALASVHPRQGSMRPQIRCAILGVDRNGWR